MGFGWLMSQNHELKCRLQAMGQMPNFEMVAVQAWQRFGRSNQCTVQHGKDIWDGLSKVELPVGCSPPLRMFGLFIHRVTNLRFLESPAVVGLFIFKHFIKFVHCW